jgi:transcriptional regulator with XRE-family HTH domain
MSRIRKYRKIAGMTQKDLAEKVGVHHAIVSDWETGKKHPRPNKKGLLCKALNIHASLLFPKELMQKATHLGVIEINRKQLDCAVLEDGTRVLTQSAVFEAFGRARRGVRRQDETGIKLPSFMDAKNLKPFINDDLIGRISPLEYVSESGAFLSGYDATILTDVCDVYLSARSSGALTHNQLPVAHMSEVLIRSLAKLGIIALIDEATGYQKDRDRKALQTILEKLIAKELQPWLKTFPDEYYEEMFRLKGWDSPSGRNRPGVVGRYTNDLIYKRLAPGVLEELEKQNPKNNKGNRINRHHQHLTPETGHPKLKEHISNVVTLMKVADGWEQFMGMVNKVLPEYDNRQLEIDFEAG